jgi:putative endonuclease
MGFLAQIRRWFAALPRRQTLGQRGEAEAVKFLKRKGYRIVARSDRQRLGEIDLVAVDGRTIVFVEVKTRRSHDKGHPADAVDQDKQRRLTRLALIYLKQHGLLESPARFDVVAVTWPEEQKRPAVEHYPHAFEAVGRGQMFG